MNAKLSIGLPKIHAEPGEKRAFLPQFISRIAKLGANIILEEGYGSSLGYSQEAYLRSGKGFISFASLEQVFQQEYVLVLRCPTDEHIRLMRAGSCLISMLHYPTRPKRVEFLRSQDLEAISLDSVKDDSGRRLIENLQAVGWNGIEIAMHVLQKIKADFYDPGREPIRVTVLGGGAVGSHAIKAAIRYGNLSLRDELYKRNVPGVIVQVVDFDLTTHESHMRSLLRNTDILVDATQRPDASLPVIPNPWIAELPVHAVLLDLSVDPYSCRHKPYHVKGLEGIPQGNLDQYVFDPQDTAYDLIPDCVDTTHRRHAVSCYSWPGIYPAECMEVYGRQLRPILGQLVERGGVERIDPGGRFFERAIARALLSLWNGSG